MIRPLCVPSTKRTRGVGLVGHVVVAVGADSDGHGHDDEELAEHGCV